MADVLPTGTERVEHHHEGEVMRCPLKPPPRDGDGRPAVDPRNASLVELVSVESEPPPHPLRESVRSGGWFKGESIASVHSDGSSSWRGTKSPSASLRSPMRISWHVIGGLSRESPQKPEAEPVPEHLRLLPNGWLEMLLQTGGTVRESMDHLGFVGHTLWCALGALPVTVGVAAWKAFACGRDGNGDRHPEVVRHVDLAIVLGAVLFFIGRCTFDLCYPKERAVKPWVASVLLWLASLCIHSFAGWAGKLHPYDIVSTAVATCVLFLSIIAFGAFGEARFVAPRFALLYAVPLVTVLAVYIVLCSAVIASLQEASLATQCGVRVALALLPPIPLAVMHVALYVRHEVLPREVRWSVAGVEALIELPLKVLTLSLPPLWCLAALSADSVLRTMVKGLLPRLAAAFSPHERETMQWQQLLLQLSYATISSFQAQLVAICGAAALIASARFRSGRSLHPSELIGYSMLYILAVSLETIVVTLLHISSHRIPVSGVYWLFRKTEHLALVTFVAALSTLVNGTPVVLDLLHAVDHYS
eukprot:Sspe_Gene.118093::Locus_110765_Transcript_1_1_Confidence_1.000_Length_1744::g.118093::m.118093